MRDASNTRPPTVRSLAGHIVTSWTNTARFLIILTAMAVLAVAGLRLLNADLDLGPLHITRRAVPAHAQPG